MAELTELLRMEGVRKRFGGLRFYKPRHAQAMVHAAATFAK